MDETNDIPFVEETFTKVEHILNRLDESEYNVLFIDKNTSLCLDWLVEQVSSDSNIFKHLESSEKSGFLTNFKMGSYRTIVFQDENREIMLIIGSNDASIRRYLNECIVPKNRHVGTLMLQSFNNGE